RVRPAVRQRHGEARERQVHGDAGAHALRLPRHPARRRAAGEVSGPRRGPAAHPAAIDAEEGRRAGAGAQGKSENRVAGRESATTQEALFHEEVAPGRVFEVVRGNLLEEPVEAIVNAANGELAHGGGVAGIISRAAGAALQEESARIVRSRGPIPTGSAVVTTAGKLPFKGVIHAGGPQRHLRRAARRVRQGLPGGGAALAAA